MTSMRKRQSAASKAKVVQELLKEDKSVTQLAAEYGIHLNQLRVESDRAGLSALAL